MFGVCRGEGSVGFYVILPDFARTSRLILLLLAAIRVSLT